MPAILLTLTFTVIVAGVVWLLIGARVRLSADPQQNELLNLVLYGVIVLPLAYLAVFLGMGSS